MNPFQACPMSIDVMQETDDRFTYNDDKRPRLYSFSKSNLGFLLKYNYIYISFTIIY
jgi:hypothetical protein